MGQQRAEVEESAAAVARGRSSRGGPRSAGRVLSDMEKADAAKALRLQKLRAEVEEGERLHETFTPVLVARPESARSAAARSSAGPAHERLYALRPSTAGGGPRRAVDVADVAVAAGSGGAAGGGGAEGVQTLVRGPGRRARGGGARRLGPRDEHRREGLVEALALLDFGAQLLQPERGCGP